MRQGIFLLSVISMLVSAAAAEGEKRPLTVADMIGMRTIITSFTDPVLLSPEGDRYLVVFQRGDVKRNGSWVEFWAGGTGSMAAAHPTCIKQMFTSSTARAHDLVRNLHWIDGREVAFLWDDGVHPPQVEALNISTRQVRALTHQSTSIAEYGVSENQVLVYTAHSPVKPDSSARRDGFVVGDQTIEAILKFEARDTVREAENKYQTFVISPKFPHPRRVIEPDLEWTVTPEWMNVSPGGKFAVAVRPAFRVPESWHSYTEHIFKDIYLPAVKRGSGTRHFIRQYELINTTTAVASPVWNAPMHPDGEVVWSPDGNYFVVGPTFLPPDSANTSGQEGRAVAVVRASDRTFVQLHLPPGGADTMYRPLEWRKDGVITLERVGKEQEQIHYRKSGQEWTQVPESGDGRRSNKDKSRVEVVVRQDPNTPPALYAIDRDSHHEMKILEINPSLQRFALGRVDAIHWKAKDGSNWTGMLYYPVNFVQGRRYPLVIQTHGYLRNQFSLDGGLPTVFAAQPLAAAGIAVIQLGGPDEEDPDALASPREPQVALTGYESVVDKLVADGIADPSKVGIVGFSRTGWHVEYALTHSSFKFAAAVVADNMDGGYLQYVLGEASQRSEFEKDAGASPFGGGLQTWERNAPGFLADRVNCPVRLELDSGPVANILDEWEFFSHLHYLGKPVELFVIPDIQHGVHILQNPAQRLASEGGAVDWFRYWLKGEKSSEPAKAAQYRRWNEMRARAEADMDGAPHSAPHAGEAQHPAR